MSGSFALRLCCEKTFINLPNHCYLQPTTSRMITLLTYTPVLYVYKCTGGEVVKELLKLFIIGCISAKAASYAFALPKDMHDYNYNYNILPNALVLPHHKIRVVYPCKYD